MQSTQESHPCQPKLSTQVGACPLDCPDGCSWIVKLEDGVPVSLRGNPDHPFTGKALCAKTNNYLDYVADPNRILYPMRRVGAKGQGKFERISWDAAIEAIAGNLKATIAEHGGEAIWPYAGSGTVGWLQGIVGTGKRLFHALGASLHSPNICSAAGHVGMGYTMGTAMGLEPEDLVHSKLILLWGTNTVETNQHLWPYISRARKENAAVVVTVDPIKTATAKRSDLHLPIKPGTDGALVLGLINRIVELEAHDQEYLNERTLGWERFLREEVEQYSMEKTAAICGIDASLIEELAQLMATRRPMGIKSAMGIQQHAGGGQALRVLSCLPAVTGAFEEPGGGICYVTGPAYRLNVDALCRPDLQPKEVRTLMMSKLGSTLTEPQDLPVKSLVIWAGNPVVSNPEQARIRAGLGREDLFTVVIDNFQTDTADYADILLPGTMQTEHMDLHDSYSHLYIQWNEPVATAPGECLPHTEIFRRIAAAMDLKEPALFASDEEMAADTLRSEHPAMEGITLESLRERGWARMQWPRPYRPFLESFPTESGKFEFISPKAENEGHGLFPHYVPPFEANRSSADGSLALITTANKGLLNSVYGSSDRHSKATVPTLTLNPKDASKLELSAGERVRVWNARGQFSATLQTNASIPPGLAHSPKGLWPKFNGGESVNATVAERDADMAQGPTFKDNRVFVSPLETSTSSSTSS